jgi:hypothetical protein
MRSTLIAALSMAVAAVPLYAGAQDKQVIQSEADLPRVTFELEAKPSELVLEDPQKFASLRDKLEVHLKSLLNDYTIEDAATKQDILSGLSSIALHRDEWQAYLEYYDREKALEDKAGERMTGGSFGFGRAYARAAIETGGDESDGFKEALREELKANVAEMDLTVARDNLESLKGQLQVITRNVIIGQLQGQLDGAAEQADMEVGRNIARTLVDVRNILDSLDYYPMAVEIIDARLAEEPEAEKAEL